MVVMLYAGGLQTMSAGVCVCEGRGVKSGIFLGVIVGSWRSLQPVSRFAFVAFLKVSIVPSILLKRKCLLKYNKKY